ncbi:MAG: glycosyltransferase family 2 protein [Stygiobacter sp.]
MSVTVIMTTYNCGEYISQAIKSVLNQTYKDFELLIIDDGSTDNTEHIVKRFDDKRINYFKIEHIGYSSAINIGLNRAKYDWVSFCDADDIIHPQKILQQFQLIKKGNNLIYTNTAFFKKNKILYELSTKNNLQLINKKIALHGHLGPSVMYNRKFILNRGAHNSNLIAFGDYELLLRILNDIEIIILPEFFYYQRLRNNSMSTTETMKKKNLIYKIQKPYYEKLEEIFGITSPKEQLIIKGWREFFYGDKNLARKYWIEAGLNQWNIKLLITFLLSYLPEKCLDYLKDKRIRLRLEYQIQRLLSRNDIQNEFDKVLGLIGE